MASKRKGSTSKSGKRQKQGIDTELLEGLWVSEIVFRLRPKAILSLICTNRFFRDLFGRQTEDFWMRICRHFQIEIPTHFERYAKIAFISTTLKLCVDCHKKTKSRDRCLHALRVHYEKCTSPCEVVILSKIKYDFHIPPSAVDSLPRVHIWGTTRKIPLNYVLAEDAKAIAIQHFGSEEAWKEVDDRETVQREKRKQQKTQKKIQTFQAVFDDIVEKLGPDFASTKWHWKRTEGYMISVSKEKKMEWIICQELRRRILDNLCVWTEREKKLFEANERNPFRVSVWPIENRGIDKWKRANPEKYRKLRELLPTITF